MVGRVRKPLRSEPRPEAHAWTPESKREACGTGTHFPLEKPVMGWQLRTLGKSDPCQPAIRPGLRVKKFFPWNSEASGHRFKAQRFNTWRPLRQPVWHRTLALKCSLPSLARVCGLWTWTDVLCWAPGPSSAVTGPNCPWPASSGSCESGSPPMKRGAHSQSGAEPCWC